MLELQPIKDRLAAATPGPWRWSRVESWGHVAKLHDIYFLPNLASLSSVHQDQADADLIAHAPSDLAALVAEVERLRGAIKAHRLKTIGNCEKYTGWTNSADRDLWILSD